MNEDPDKRLAAWHTAEVQENAVERAKQDRVDRAVVDMWTAWQTQQYYTNNNINTTSIEPSAEALAGPGYWDDTEDGRVWVSVEDTYEWPDPPADDYGPPMSDDADDPVMFWSPELPTEEDGAWEDTRPDHPSEPTPEPDLKALAAYHEGLSALRPTTAPLEHPLVTIMRDMPAQLEYICMILGGKAEDALPLLEGTVTDHLRERAKFYRRLDL